MSLNPYGPATGHVSAINSLRALGKIDLPFSQPLFDSQALSQLGSAPVGVGNDSRPEWLDPSISSFSTGRFDDQHHPAPLPSSMNRYSLSESLTAENRSVTNTPYNYTQDQLCRPSEDFYDGTMAQVSIDISPQACAREAYHSDRPTLIPKSCPATQPHHLESHHYSDEIYHLHPCPRLWSAGLATSIFLPQT
jgi:hypothetical protein